MKYVDFGNAEEREEEYLRPAVLLSVPIQCYACQIHDVIPVSHDVLINTVVNFRYIASKNRQCFEAYECIVDIFFFSPNQIKQWLA